MSTGRSRAPHVTAVRREGVERVTPLELFFDLVFVLAITQCTAMMSHDRTWHGVGQAMLVLAVLWWAWTSYAWLTSVLDPEEGTVRIVMFAATAAMLVAALCVPHVFGSTAGLFACSYAVVRIAHIGLFALASRDDPSMRRSVIGLAVGTAIGAGLIGAASFTNGTPQAVIWLVALVLDAAGPQLLDSEGWVLAPSHFAERHALIVLIAIGESIVAIGVGAEVGLDAGVVVAAVLSVAVSAALFTLYFDIVALVATRRLERAAAGSERNDVARIGFSYLHLPMVAAIDLTAFGVEVTLHGVSDHLAFIPAFALLGGPALYLLAHVAFRWYNVRRFSVDRSSAAALCLALLPLAVRIPALATLGILALVLSALVGWERLRFAELRERLRSELYT